MLFTIAFILSFLTTTSWAALKIPIALAKPQSTDGTLSKRVVVDPLARVGGPGSTRYTLNGTLGTPPQGPISWLIDTGSTVMYTPAYNSTVCTTAPGCVYGSFNPSLSSTFVLTYVGGLNVRYGDGSYGVTGDLFNDTLSIAGATITDVEQGLATTISPVLGSLGLIGLSFNGSGVYPSILGQLQNQGFIDRAAFSVWENSASAAEGELVFGGVDPAKYTGSLIATTMQQDAKNGYTTLSAALTGFSLIDAEGVSHSLEPTGYQGASMLIDTGTPGSLVLPPDLLSLFLTAVGASNENGTFVVPCDLISSTATLDFTFGGSGGPTITMPLSALVAGQSPIDTPFFAADGSSIPACDLTGVSPSSSTNTGVLGVVWQQWAYMVFDLQNKVIALAESAQNTTASSVQDIGSGVAIPGASSTVSYQVTSPGVTSASYVSTLASSTVSGTVTGYPCVTPEYDLGVSACHPTTSSSSSTTSTTSSTTTSSTTTSSSTSSSTTTSSSTSSSSTSSSATSSSTTSSSSSTTSSSTSKSSTCSSSTSTSTSSKKTSTSTSSSTSTTSTPSPTSATWTNSWTSSGFTSSASASSSSTWKSSFDPTGSVSSSSSTSTLSSSGTWSTSSLTGSSSFKTIQLTTVSVLPWTTITSTSSSKSQSIPSALSSPSTSDGPATGAKGAGSWQPDPEKTSSTTSQTTSSPGTAWSTWSADPSSSVTPTYTSENSEWGSWPADPTSYSSSSSKIVATSAWASTLTASAGESSASAIWASPASSSSSAGYVSVGAGKNNPGSATLSTSWSTAGASSTAAGAAATSAGVSSAGAAWGSASQSATSPSAYSPGASIKPFTGAAAGTHTPTVAMIVCAVAVAVAALF